MDRQLGNRTGRIASEAISQSLAKGFRRSVPSRLGELGIGGSDAGMTTGVLFGLGLRPAKL